MSKTVLEQALDHLLNKEEDKASALLHDYYVGIGRQVYEDIMADDINFEDEDLNAISDLSDEVDADLTEEGDDEVAPEMGDEEAATADLGADMGAEAQTLFLNALKTGLGPELDKMLADGNLSAEERSALEQKVLEAEAIMKIADTEIKRVLSKMAQNDKLEEIKKMLLIIEEEYEIHKKNNENEQIVKYDPDPEQWWAQYIPFYGLTAKDEARAYEERIHERYIVEENAPMFASLHMTGVG